MSIPLTHHAYCDFRQSVVEGAPHRPCDCWLDDSAPEPSDDRELLTIARHTLEGVSHALESLVDPDMAHDDPARAARIVAEMVAERDTLNDAALRAAYASGFMAGHACGVHEPDLSSDDVFGTAANGANQYVAVPDDPGQYVSCDPAVYPELVE